MALDFNDLQVREEEVPYKGTLYILREADEEAAKLYRSSLLRGAKMVDKSVQGLEGTAEASAVLVSQCLFRADPNTGKILLLPGPEGLPDKRHLVSLKTVLSWPQRVIKAVFERAKEISELDEKKDKAALIKQRDEASKALAAMEEEPLKNEQSSTETSS